MQDDFCPEFISFIDSITEVPEPLTTCENCKQSWAPDELLQEDSDNIFDNGWCASCNRKHGY